MEVEMIDFKFDRNRFAKWGALLRHACTHRAIMNTLFASFLACLLGISGSAGMAMWHTIDEPAIELAKAKIDKHFFDPKINTIEEIKEKKLNGVSFVFVKGAHYCERENCLTVVFDENDPSKIASLMSNGKFVVMDSPRLRWGGHIIFSPQTTNDISLIVMPTAFIVAPPLR
jgi:hypothetical protein